ncbi:uncharacterized protein LOC111624810 [Centruroides sculpturatus]|uniref:uncharacterized protein LOC111624810 n=1 Tax=Centruroides sculpturatus TaxID=218467 RepID=UPI000C6DFDBA|nr:uncharacterized protein LOC111624810 [Centruroides sculpturatus]
MAGTTTMDNGTKSPLKIIVNIFISFIGAGILGLPYAFKESGLLEGIFIMILVSVFSTRAMMLIIQCKYKILGINITNGSLRHAIPMEEKYDLTRIKKWEEIKQLLLTTDEEQDCMQMVINEYVQSKSSRTGPMKMSEVHVNSLRVVAFKKTPSSVAFSFKNIPGIYLLGTLSVVTLLYIAFGVSGYMFLDGTVD